MNKRRSTAKRDILLLISVPLGLLVLLAAIVYVPQALARPTQDFIYTLCEDYYCGGRVGVHDGRVRYQPELGVVRNPRPPILRYYDVSAGSARPLTLQEAEDYQIDSSSRSVDGYALISEASSSGFLFGGSSRNGWALKNGLYKKPVELGATDPYSSDVKFIGWVK